MLFGQDLCSDDMFQALVLACMVLQPDQCLQLEDQRGPYKTYERCEARVYEMSRVVHIYLKGYKPVSWKCVPLPKGKLSV